MGCSEASGDDGSVLRTGRQGLYGEVSGVAGPPWTLAWGGGTL